jgi:hypothetical protein
MKHVPYTLFLISIGCLMLGATSSATLSMPLFYCHHQHERESLAEIPMEPTLSAERAVSLLICNFGEERFFIILIPPIIDILAGCHEASNELILAK